MNQKEENIAILKCQQGEIAGLEVLVRNYQLPALRIAYLLLGDYTIAEDIVQESFIAVYKGIGQYDCKRPFASWFYRIVTNTARQHLRSTRRHPALSLDHYTQTNSDIEDAGLKNILALKADISPEHDPATFVEQSAMQNALLLALSELTIKQHEAIVLRYYCNCSERQMATILHCLPGTVKWRLHAGLRALERIIRQRYDWLLQEYDLPSSDALASSLEFIKSTTI